MRLLLIASEFPPGPGGIGNHAQQLALNLQRLGWEVSVVSPQDYVTNQQVLEFNAKQPFPVVSVPSRRGRFFEAFHRLRIASLLARKYRPDILIGTGLSGVMVAAALSALRRLPSLAVAHGSEFGVGGSDNRRRRSAGDEPLASRTLAFQPSSWMQPLIRLGYEHTTAVVAVSQFTRGVLLRAGIRPARLEVIPNAADGQRFNVLPKADCRAFRKSAGFNGCPLILTVGQISERKGQEVVIRALPEILRRVPGAHYVLIGIPTLQAPLTRLAEELQVRDHVHFLGPVQDGEVVYWLNCADLFVMTSRTTNHGDCEGFGIAVVEAALCGKPSVVSAQSGLLEAIEDQATGLAVPENDDQATAQAVVALLSDGPRRTAMGAAAQTRARREQTWETCARRYDALLRSLIARN